MNTVLIRAGAILLLSAVLLTSCAGQPAASSAPGSSASASGAVSPARSTPDAPQNDSGSLPTDYVIDPPYDFDPDQMLPRDFGDYFTQDFEGCQVSTYKIGEGSQWENEVTLIQSENEGPVIYVIAAVHGDEEAAWRAGDLLQKITIQSGALYILSPANPWGAALDPPSRYVVLGEDLNRSFPGDLEGSPGEQAAAFIFADVERVQPDFVFDLHEARIVSEGRDFLGSSLIFSSLDGMADLFLGMITDSESGLLCSEPFQYYSPGPAGSVNNTITTQLGIPTITVETFRGYEMERRIGDQLDVVQYVMRYYGMVP